MSANVYDEPLPRTPNVLETVTTRSGGAHTHLRISWSAVFGGVILVVAVELVLGLLGAGIGLGTVNLNAATTPDASSLGIGAGVWWIVSSVIALAFGGFVAAWLAGVEIRWDGLLHGLITWGIASLLTIYLLTSAIGGIGGGGASMLGGLTSAAGSGLKTAAQPLAQATGMTPDSLQNQARAYLKPAVGNADPASLSPQDAQKDVVTNLATYAEGGSGAPAAKERVIDIMAAQQHVSRDQAAQQFNNDQSRLEQKKAQAIQMAKNAADASAAAVSKTSFAAFADLLIGALAAALGGSLAVQRRQHVSRRAVH